MLKSILFGFLLSTQLLQAQSMPASLSQRYDSVVSGHLDLYYGRKPLLYSPVIQGHPYLGSGNWMTGEVFYKHARYQASLLYDLASDRLLVDDPHHGGIELLNEQIDYFMLEGRLFKPLSGKEINTPMYSSGFYEILYDGNMQFIARHLKQIKKEQKDYRETQYFDPVTRYLIRLNGTYYAIKNKNTVVRVFKGHDKELARALRQSNLDFGNNFAYALTQFLIQYEAK